MRTATVERKTRETEIVVSLDLDGTGECDIDTVIGFLDHMLESFGRHSMMDLKVRAQGDLHVDYHHTTEDTAIVIGQAIKKALGDFSGIRRFGSCLMPMDETLAVAAIDLSGRPYPVVDLGVRAARWRARVRRWTVSSCISSSKRSSRRSATFWNMAAILRASCC